MARRRQPASLPAVYAKGDGGVLLRGTRWEPRRVLCSRSADGSGAAIDYVVKYRRPGAIGAAALISEVVCHSLLKALSIGTLEAALVMVDGTIASLYTERHLTSYAVEEGAHFGTVYRPDLEPADPRTWNAAFIGILADPGALIDLWAADSWFMNLDRAVSGNILLEVDTHGDAHLIAADQSDCFLGAGALADGSWFVRSQRHGPAPYLPLLERIFLQEGVERLRHIVQRIQGMQEAVGRAVEPVPDPWWRQATVSSRAVVDCLLERAGRIDQIVELAKWEELGRVIKGAEELGL